MKQNIPRYGSKELNSLTKTCPVCDSQDIWIFLEIQQVPVCCNILWSTRAAAINAPKADMRLGFCRNCGHIYNLSFDPVKVDYTQNYENSLNFSPRFQAYARSLATRLIERHNLYDKDVIEIGCGRGEFLNLLCKIGGNRGIGFDPCQAIASVRSFRDSNITFVQDFYSKKYASHKADLICCRHVLEHIQFPRLFLRNLHRTIRKQAETLVFFEVPNVMFTLKGLSIWDLIYEHCSYFCTISLARAFNSSGFEVLDLYEVFNEQFLCVETRPVDNKSRSKKNTFSDVLEGMVDDVSRFCLRYCNKVEKWKGELERMDMAGHKVVVWGGGSKGVTFLNIFKSQDTIEYVIDINPHKHRMHIAGTGQEIMPPDFLTKYKPDVIIAMNPIYLEEIQQITSSMNLSCGVISA